MNDFLLRIGDVLFGWVLRLPMDLALILVAVGSSTILAVVRRWTTDQDLLTRCAADKRRLGELMREAKGRKDGDAVQRHRATLAKIGLVQMRQEGRPLLAAIVPLAILAMWAFGRLEFHAPAAGEPIEIVAHFPVSAAGRLVHMVPQAGVEADGGWVKEIREVEVDGQTGGEAAWVLKAEKRDEPYVLEFRYGRKDYKHALVVGNGAYLAPLEFHDEQLLATEARLRQVKLFGIVPGIPAMGLAPWMVAYLILVVASVPVVKRCLRLK
jgi:uncharacterized membrane protein (DUF106 family)